MLRPAQFTEPVALVDERPGDLLAQHRLGGVAKPRDHSVVHLKRLLRPAQLTEPAALVDERHGDLLAQRQLGGVAKPPDHIIVGLHSVLGIAEGLRALPVAFILS